MESLQGHLWLVNLARDRLALTFGKEVRSAGCSDEWLGLEDEVLLVQVPLEAALAHSHATH